MSYENLLFEKRDRIAIVTINRPKVLNALSEGALEELDACFEDIRKDADVGAAILTGAGEKAFVAGADIGDLATYTPQRAMEGARYGQEVFTRIENIGKPTIAAVNGYALGGGCELALACSLRIASQNAKLGLPEVKLGIIPGYGGSQRLPRLIGKGRAFELMLIAEPVSAEEALRLGLVNRVTPPDQLLPTAEAMAKKMIANGPLALQYCMEAVNRGMDMSLEEGLRFESVMNAMCFATQDVQEGIRAFFEKRPARFTRQ